MVNQGNRMKFIKKIAMVISFLLVSSQLNAEQGVVSYEIEPVFYYLGKSLNGSVHLPGQCEHCSILKLKITPKTKAIVNHKEVSLASVVGKKQPTFVAYHKKTKQVRRMYWYNQ